MDQLQAEADVAGLGNRETMLAVLMLLLLLMQVQNKDESC